MPGKKARVRKPREKKRLSPGSHVRDPVPVAPVREVVLRAMEERGMTLSDVAVLAGQEKRYANGKRKAESTWVQRRLGLKPESVEYKNGRAYRSQPHEFISRDVAVRLVRAVGEFPCDVRDPESGEALL